MDVKDEKPRTEARGIIEILDAVPAPKFSFFEEVFHFPSNGWVIIVGMKFVGGQWWILLENSDIWHIQSDLIVA